jgi:hypothetical protein
VGPDLGDVEGVEPIVSGFLKSHNLHFQPPFRKLATTTTTARIALSTSRRRGPWGSRQTQSTSPIRPSYVEMRSSVASFTSTDLLRDLVG